MGRAGPGPLSPALPDPAPEAVAATIRTVRRRGFGARVTLSSSDFAALETVQLAPELDPCLLIGDREELAEDPAWRGARATDLLGRQRHWVERAAAAGFAQVAMPSEDLSAAIVAAARNRAIELGSNGLTINWPERLIHALLEYMAQRPGSELRQRPTRP